MTLADVRTEHPLAMTTAEEVERVRAALAEAGLLGDTVRFAFFLPEEPPKAEVLNFDDPERQGPPLDVAQADRDHPARGRRASPSTATWSPGRTGDLRVGFDAREGLTLHQISFTTGPAPIIYRASIAEMVVPYADPTPGRGSGRTTSTPASTCSAATPTRCELGCDCLGEITLLRRRHRRRRWAARKVIQNAICMHEEDYGVLWKHTDMFTGIARDPPPAAAGRSRSSSPSATTTTASTGTSTSTAPSSSRSRPPASCSPSAYAAGRPYATAARARASARRTTSTCSAPGWT